MCGLINTFVTQKFFIFNGLYFLNITRTKGQKLQTTAKLNKLFQPLKLICL